MSCGPICSNELAICVCACVGACAPFSAFVWDSVRCALLPVHTWGHVCARAIVRKIKALPVPFSLLGASWGYAWPSRMQGVCVCVCESIHTLHPSQLPHMSTPHRIPGATAAITVTKEPSNSFITQSTRALMTPWTKSQQQNQNLKKFYDGQTSPASRENALLPKGDGCVPSNQASLDMIINSSRTCF